MALDAWLLFGLLREGVRDKAFERLGINQASGGNKLRRAGVLWALHE